MFKLSLKERYCSFLSRVLPHENNSRKFVFGLSNRSGNSAKFSHAKWRNSIELTEYISKFSTNMGFSLLPPNFKRKSHFSTAAASVMACTLFAGLLSSDRVACNDSKNSPSSQPFLTSVQAIKGHRPYMEDDNYVSQDGRFCAVYDGHGGAAISKYLRQNLYAQFQQALHAPIEDCNVDKVKEALVQSYCQVDQEVQKVAHWSFQGSTAVVCVCHPIAFLTANVGDSRAVLSRRNMAIELTEDHKPNNPNELARIKKLGGTVKWYGYLDPEGKPVEGTGVYRINGNLAVARAIGDRTERPFVSGEVEIRQFSRDAEGDQFVILASDGLWDVMTSEEAVDLVHLILEGQVGALRTGRFKSQDHQTEIKVSDWTQQYGNDRGLIRAAMLSRKRKMARYLAEEALRRGTSDNITVIVMWLQ